MSASDKIEKNIARKKHSYALLPISLPSRKSRMVTQRSKKSSPSHYYQNALASEGGPDGTRTRDPMRDRHVF